MTAVTANRDLFAGRRFADGLKFRTLCADCNNGLGGREDKAVGTFVESIRKMIESPLMVAPRVKIAAKPNLIYRGLLAHIASANDNGVETDFDVDARNVFQGKMAMRSCPWNLFYWTYLEPTIFLQRRTFLGVWSPMTLIPMYILKFYPIAFLFTTTPWFGGLPNMKAFLQRSDDDEFDLPVRLAPADLDPVWPSRPGNGQVVFMGGDAYGILGFRD